MSLDRAFAWVCQRTAPIPAVDEGFDYASLCWTYAGERVIPLQAIDLPVPDGVVVLGQDTQS